METALLTTKNRRYWLRKFEIFNDRHAKSDTDKTFRLMTPENRKVYIAKRLQKIYHESNLKYRREEKKRVWMRFFGRTFKFNYSREWIEIIDFNHPDWNKYRDKSEGGKYTIGHAYTSIRGRKPGIPKFKYKDWKKRKDVADKAELFPVRERLAQYGWGENDFVPQHLINMLKQQS